jgi:2-hydroxychromene-2-carboxylate isomerase
MKRSAAFYGLAYNEPVKLPMSSHLAARLYHVVDAQNAGQTIVLARTLFHAFFVDQQDISQEDVLLRLSLKAGLDEATARDALSAPLGRTLLEKAVTRATADKVVGSPFFLVDGVGFFGADRLPQLRWFLAGHQRADLF